MKRTHDGFTENFGLVGKSLRRYLTTTALTATGLMAIASPALADNWTDHVADEGSISIDTSVPSTTNITQNTDFVKVHGDGDINAGWTVNVAQPSSSSKYVLYDTEADPTEIMGTLNANGRIYIFDKNGVIFGENSQVNVGGIVASTKYLDDSTIKNNGVGEFKPFNDDASSEGAIAMKGAINIREAGLAAFVAPNIENSGIINAKMGTVAMASGEKVTLDLYGDNLVEIAVDGNLGNTLIKNSGTIKAEGGNVVISAAAAKDAVDNVINMDGVIDVSSVSVKGGKIVLNGGKSGVVNVAGKLKADGKDGGSVSVTGQNILLDTSSVLSANALTAGNGGTVDVVADNGLIFGGTIDAKGGALSGDGGAVDTSGKGFVNIDGTVDASAVNGENGSWLIDPTNLIISAFTGNAAGTGTSADPFKSSNFFSYLKVSSIESALANGSDVYIKTVGTPNSFGQDGTIFMYDSITKTSTNDSVLHMDAAGSIYTTDIISTGGKLGIDLDAVGSINIGGTMDTNGGNVDLTSSNDWVLTTTGSKIITKGGDVNFNAKAEIFHVGSIDTAGGDFTAIAGKRYYSYADSKVLTKGGDITIKADGPSTTVLGLESSGVVYNYGLLDAAGGDIDIHQTGSFVGGADTVRTSGAGTINLVQHKTSILSSIQNAIDSILNTGTGTNTVTVGAGTFDEDITADVNNLVLKGANAGIAGDGVRGAETKITPHSPGIHVTADNVTVDGFEVTGATGADGYGVWVDNADNAIIENNKIHDNAATGILANNGSTNVKIDANKIYNLGLLANSADGIHVAGVSGGVETNGNVIDNVKGNGIFVNGSGLINVLNNKIGLLATDSALNGIWGDGIEINDVNGATVQGNNVSNTYDPTNNNTNDNSSGVYLRNSSNVVVGGLGLNEGNNLTNIDWDGVKIAGGTGNLVQGNYINKTTRIGIYGEGAHNLTIDSNTVINANLDGYGGITVLGGENQTISNNDVTGPASDADSGIYFAGVNSGVNKIINNIVHAVKGTGIEVHNVTNVDINDNTVTDTNRDDGVHGDGILLDASNGTLNVIGNTVGDVGGATIIKGNGIHLTGINGATVQGNKIYYTEASNPSDGDDASGIYLDHVSNILVGGPGVGEGNFIRNADWDGVKIADGTGNIVQGNDISDVTRIGIYGEGTHNITVDNNHVANGNLDGYGAITILGGENQTISNNDVTGPASGNDSGIYFAGVNGGVNKIINNIVHAVKGTGIEVHNVTNVDINNNTVTATNRDDGVHGDGILLDASNGTLNVIGNTVGDVGGATIIKGNGIHLTGINGATVQGNKIYYTEASNPSDGDDASGIYLDHVSNILVGGSEEGQGNFIRNADWDGVKIADGTGNIVQGNDIAHSTRIGIYGEGTHSLQVLNNTVFDSNLQNWGGITVLGGENHAVDNNDVSDIIGVSGADAGIYMAFVNGGNNEINGNNVHAINGPGIHVSSTNDIDVNDNTIAETYGNGIEVINVGGEINVKNNVIGDSGAATFIQGNGIYLTGLTGAIVQSNQIYYTQTLDHNDGDDASGIYLDHVSNVTVGGYDPELGNLIRNADWDGIKVASGADNLVQNNDIAHSTRIGIYGEGTDHFQVLNNTVFDSNLQNWGGITVLGGNNHTIYFNDVSNALTSSGTHGIYLGGSGIYSTIGYNNVHDIANGDGIHVDTVTGDLYVGNNNVEDVADDGVSVNNFDYADVYLNNIDNAGGNGILVTNGSLADVTNNVDPSYNPGSDGKGITNVGKNGIFVDSVDFVNVINNIIDFSGWDGIHVSNFDTAFIGSNTVSRSGDDGIEAHDGHSIEIDSNLVSQSGLGFVVTDPEDGDDPEEYDNAYDEFLGGHDGISVRNIYGKYVEVEDGDEGEGEISAFAEEGDYLYAPGIVRITNNQVFASDDDEGEISARAITGSNPGVSISEDDGIEVSNVEGYVYIANNNVDQSGVSNEGESFGGYDQYGADGIHVRNVFLYPYGYDSAVDNHYREGDIGNGEYNIVVADNTVANSLDDGIEILGAQGNIWAARTALVSEDDEYAEYGDHFNGIYGEDEGEENYAYGSTGRVLVSGNTVSNSGYGFGDGFGYSDYYSSGGDGIHVEGVYANGEYASAGSVGDGEFSGYAVDVLDNNVSNSGDDGIDVEYSSSTLISGNTVTNSGLASNSEDEFDAATGDFYGADGIFVHNVGTESYDEDEEETEVGTEFQPYSVVIRDNNVSNSQDDGIEVLNDDYGMQYTNPILIDINTVTDSGSHGLYVAGAYQPNDRDGNGSVIVTGNAFANFDIGAEFESGLIDLTGPGNSFDNGRIGLRFAPFGYAPASDEPEPAFAKLALFNDVYLNLVDDDGAGSTPYPDTPTNFGGTIGAQTFTNISQYYVDLEAGAMTNDVTPIWLNGLNSTYDGLTPSDTDGILSQADFDNLEAKFFHFPDAGDRDIFWFGFVPSDVVDINQSLIFNRFAAFNGDVTGLNVQIRGLPTVPGAGPAPTQNFNDINTFAGGDANTGNPGDLNSIQTAAGGSTQAAAGELNNVEASAGGDNQACWSNAVSAAGAGQVVNVVYGGSFDDNLAGASTCGTTF